MRSPSAASNAATCGSAASPIGFCPRFAAAPVANSRQCIARRCVSIDRHAVDPSGGINKLDEGQPAGQRAGHRKQTVWHSYDGGLDVIVAGLAEIVLASGCARRIEFGERDVDVRAGKFIVLINNAKPAAVERRDPGVPVHRAGRVDKGGGGNVACVCVDNLEPDFGLSADGARPGDDDIAAVELRDAGVTVVRERNVNCRVRAKPGIVVKNWTLMSWSSPT